MKGIADAKSAVLMTMVAIHDSINEDSAHMDYVIDNIQSLSSSFNFSINEQVSDLL